MRGRTLVAWLAVAFWVFAAVGYVITAIRYVAGYDTSAVTVVAALVVTAIFCVKQIGRAA